MGLFSRKKSKPVEREYFSDTSKAIGDILDLALRYLVDDNLLDTYSEKRLDIDFINKSRAELETAIVNLGKSIAEYYNYEYTSVKDETEAHKNFQHSIDALVTIFNNSIDLYVEDNNSRERLNAAYIRCIKELEKVKEILSDDEVLQAFTGISPVEREEVNIEEEKVIEEDPEGEEVETEADTEADNLQTVEVINEISSDEVDGDVIADTDKMRVYFIRMSRNEEDEININLCIKNKTDNEVVVKCKDVSVDRVSTEPTFNCIITGNDMVYDKMILNKEIQQLVNFKGTFFMVEKDTSEIIDESSASIFEE